MAPYRIWYWVGGLNLWCFITARCKQTAIPHDQGGHETSCRRTLGSHSCGLCLVLVHLCRSVSLASWSYCPPYTRSWHGLGWPVQLICSWYHKVNNCWKCKEILFFEVSTLSDSLNQKQLSCYLMLRLVYYLFRQAVPEI